MFGDAFMPKTASQLLLRLIKVSGNYRCVILNSFQNPGNREILSLSKDAQGIFSLRFVGIKLLKQEKPMALGSLEKFKEKLLSVPLNLKHSCATNFTNSSYCFLVVFHCDVFVFFTFSFCSTFYTVHILLPHLLSRKSFRQYIRPIYSRLSISLVPNLRLLMPNLGFLRYHA